MGADDLFDVVDAQDRPVRAERRSVVHREGLLHRAVHILLRNAGGEVFLQRRSPLKDLNPDCWDSSCSGHVDSGEDYDPAAFREVGEELGVALRPGDIARLMKIEACRQTGNEFVWVYTGWHDGPFVLQPEEISGGRFFAPAEIDRGIAETPREFSSAFRYIWQQARERLPARS
jgi:isopentenyl-diphosphate delta-isomerase